MTLPLDFQHSPHTGWTRAHWEDLAQGMLSALDPYWSPTGARIDLPGPASATGSVSDGLEGFARTFLIAGFLVAGRGGDPDNVLEPYARGLASGTDPASPEAWQLLDEEMQTKVEAASIALTLQLTRPWLWDRLDDRVRERTVDWLSRAVGQWYPPGNWVWFRIIVESFLREVGGPWSATDIEEGLAVHASLRRADGWMADGQDRSYDHYVGWALHMYPLLWTRYFDVTGTLVPSELQAQWTADLGRYTDDVLHLIGADGAPLAQGRSLVYRFAAAAPLWMSAITGAGKHTPGRLRRAVSGIVSHFTQHGALEPDGLLSLGWHGSWPAMSQSYSGPGSPYWAAKGMLGLLLPQDHPVWTDVEEPLPVETGDFVRKITAPGWLVSGRKRDGIVTVLNHGTDHARPGNERTDSPLYARLGYSTATMPPLGEASAADPLDNTVVLLDRTGRASHRSGFRPLFAEETGDGTLVAASQGSVRWVDASKDTTPDLGVGRTGILTPGPALTVASALRDGTEVRLARVDGPTQATTLRVSGWPVSSPKPLQADSAVRNDQPVASAESADLHSAVTALHGLDQAGVAIEQDVSPLGEHTAVPWLATHAVTQDEVVAAVVTLGRQPANASTPVVTAERLPGQGHRIAITWHDGASTEFVLPT
ncbi:DUF2264 domain-containing protein [Streptomyces scopuliridis]|uniref:DUF2264 domain-containing protein n=1 Tax=Streptomyces scopuliridis TaxID=452529 RepID=UPI0036C13E86